MAASTYPAWLAGQRITAGQLNSMLPLEISKPLDEPVTSSTALQNDNDLVAPITASASYDFEAALFYEGGTLGASDLKWQWTGPPGVTMRYGISCFGIGGGWNGQNGFFNGVQTASTNGAGVVRPIMMTGSFTVGVTGGNLTLQWAQNTSSATPTIVHAQSVLKIRRTA